MTDNQDLEVVCEACSGEYWLSAGLKERKVTDKGLRDVTEVGILCPLCEHWQHSYFMNDRLRKMAAALERVKASYTERQTEHRWQKFQAKVQAYRKAHATFNRRLRKRLGVEGPTVETSLLKEAAAHDAYEWNDLMTAILLALNGRTLNGYEIIQQIQEDGGDEVPVATLYSHLAALEEMGEIVVDRVVAEDKGERKYFALSDRGQERVETVLEGSNE